MTSNDPRAPGGRRARSGRDAALRAATTSMSARSRRAPHGRWTGGLSQLSAAALRALRSTCPLGFMRYSIVAKGYEMREAFVDDLRGLILFPSGALDLVEPYRPQIPGLLAEARAEEAL